MFKKRHCVHKYPTKCLYDHICYSKFLLRLFPTFMAVNSNSPSESGTSGLSHYVTPLMACALAVGCTIGWGAFVMPATTLLPMCGPVGTSLGFLVGTVLILVIAANYHYLINRCQDPGGAFAFARRAFGYDHSFLCGVFLVLTYVTMLWANGTSFSVLAGYLFGDTFRVGPHYVVAGYDVYLGEACLGAGAIALFSLIAMKTKTLAGIVLTAFAMIMVLGIVVLSVGAFVNVDEPVQRMEPMFASGSSPVSQVWMCIAFVPWAFVGFETLSNSSGEFRFSPRKSFGILAVAVIVSVICYILVMLLSALSIPDEFGNWMEYMDHMHREHNSVPMLIFSGAGRFLGNMGVPVLGLVIAGALITSIIANTVAASRLLFALGKDEIFSPWFARLSRDGVPSNAILFIALCSVGMPFLGRTVISWTVDMTTIGAVFAYAYTSAAAVRIATLEKFSLYRVTGIAGVAISALFMLFLLIPHIFTGNILESESYLMLAFWSIIGFFFFRVVFKKDRRFGNSAVVGIALLALIFFALLMWVRQATFVSVKESVNNIYTFYENAVASSTLPLTDGQAGNRLQYVGEQLASIKSALHENSLIQFFSMVLALLIMFSVYSIIRRREMQMEMDKLNAEQSNRAKSTFLSNMSHDIRTPMNAIIGYTDIALQPGVSLEEIREYLRKISSSGTHLMELVNDVLEMSRIESGRLELRLESNDIVQIIEDIRDLFSNQMSKKQLEFLVDTSAVSQRRVLCDGHYLKRIIVNLVVNALKFTPEKGRVELILAQERYEVAAANEGEQDSNAGPGRIEDNFSDLTIPRREDETALYVITVRDNGIGMSQEFASKVFEPFERERTSTVSGITGTGLGMAITKTLIDMMGGTVTLKTAQGKGTEFTVRVPLHFASGQVSGEPADAGNAAAPVPPPAEGAGTAAPPAPENFAGRRLLLAEDIAINREIAVMSLKRFGFEVETAENGQVALDMLKKSEPGYYDAVLMDIQMPVMDGHEASRQIRALGNRELASVPIVAMTANAFVEDVEAEKSSGIDAHISKPLNVKEMIATIASVLK